MECKLLDFFCSAACGTLINWPSRNSASERCFICRGRASLSFRRVHRRTSFNSLRTVGAQLMERAHVTSRRRRNLLAKNWLQSHNGGETARDGRFAGPIDTATHRSLIHSRLLRQRDVITGSRGARRQCHIVIHRCQITRSVTQSSFLRAERNKSLKNRLRIYLEAYVSQNPIRGLFLIHRTDFTNFMTSLRIYFAQRFFVSVFSLFILMSCVKATLHEQTRRRFRLVQRGLYTKLSSVNFYMSVKSLHILSYVFQYQVIKLLIIRN